MKLRHYILEGRDVVQAVSWQAYLHWRLTHRMAPISQTRVRGHFVSTIFLGIDHSWSDGPPVLFETMVFKGHAVVSQIRAETYAQAARLHQLAVRELSRPWRYHKRDMMPAQVHPHTARVYCLRPPVN